MMKKEYLNPQLSLICVEHADILTFSVGTSGTSMNSINIDDLLNGQNS